jgi:transposase
MPRPIPLRSDFDAVCLRRLARVSRDANQSRRLLALATIYGGGARGEAAAVGGVTLQIIRDGVVRFNAEGPAALIDRKAPGQPPLLNTQQRRALVQIVEAGPTPAIHGVVRWRLVDLAQWIWEEFRITVSEATIGRVLNELGYRKLSARPRHHAQDPEAAGIFKKTFPPSWRKSRATRRRARR